MYYRNNECARTDRRIFKPNYSDLNVIHQHLKHVMDKFRTANNETVEVAVLSHLRIIDNLSDM